MTRLDQAFKAIDRGLFLPEEEVANKDIDAPLPIGFGQTNSQPSTVHQMLEWLSVQQGDTILDVGSGSGWTTAILARLAGNEGHVYAIEVIPELVKFGRINCEKVGATNVSFHHAGTVFGLPDKAPFDRILVSADSRELPQELLDQLSSKGKMVIPVLGVIHEVERSEDDFTVIEHPGYAFVPLIK